MADTLKKDELIPTLVERLKDNGVDGLAFDALLKNRTAQQWDDLRKAAIDAFVEKKVQEAMGKFNNRL